MPTKKLGNLHGRIAYGCAGSAGLKQRVVERLRATISAEDCELPLCELRPKIFKVVNQLQHDALAEHVQLTNSEPAHVAFLFGGVDDGTPWIYEIDVAGRDQEHFISEAIGQAAHFAHYGLMHHNHYELAKRDLKQVRMFAFRITANTILTDASGAAGVGSIQMYQVDSTGATELSDDEMKAMAYTLGVWQTRERDIFAGFHGAEDGGAAGSSPVEKDASADDGIKL